MKRSIKPLLAGREQEREKSVAYGESQSKIFQNVQEVKFTYMIISELLPTKIEI